MSCDSAGVDFIMSKAVREAYKLGEDDETLKPLVLVDMMGKPMGRIETGDYIIFYDIRGEREIELTSSFTDPDRVGFRTKEGLKVNFVTMIQYDEGLQTKVAFPPPTEIADTLSQVLGRNGLRQAKVVESEKAAHLTFFFNGRSRQTAPLEERVIVPSLEVRRADDRPEMNISEVAREIVSRINDPGYNVIIASFANVDVVGHIENRQAIIRAVEAVDHYTGMVVGAAIKAGVTAIITADHGTVEEWLYPDGTTDTGHTDSPVPFILIDPDPSYASKVVLRKKGELADVAPTMLEVLGLPKPRAMAGQSLLLSPPQIAYCRRVLLLILDGWGINHKCEGNLIAQASTPVMEHLQAYPFALLSASGEAVGLPEGTVGNSEAGHLHLGTGRRVYSDRVRIDKAIEDGSFFTNEAFLWAINGARRDHARLHLLGIVSFFSSHGSVDHLKALLQVVQSEGAKEVYIHSILGRRGEHLESGGNYVQHIEQEVKRTGVGRVASVIGRHWALDREQHWDRVEKTYRMLAYGDGKAVPFIQQGNTCGS